MSSFEQGLSPEEPEFWNQIHEGVGMSPEARDRLYLEEAMDKQMRASLAPESLIQESLVSEGWVLRRNEDGTIEERGENDG